MSKYYSIDIAHNQLHVNDKDCRLSVCIYIKLHKYYIKIHVGFSVAAAGDKQVHDTDRVSSTAT